jgi:hypothetical protein
MMFFGRTQYTPKPSPAIIVDGELIKRFPPVDPLHKPTGSDVLVQVRSPQTHRIVKGPAGDMRIDFADDVIKSEKWNQEIGLVLKLGPACFRNRTTWRPWQEGAWFAIGDLVRIPKTGGNRWEISYVDDDGLGALALFACFRDTEIRAVVTDPAQHERIKAYV